MKASRLMLVLLVVWGLFLPGCGNSGDAQSQSIPFTTLQKAEISPFGNNPAQVSVIRNEVDWATFWDVLYTNYSEKPPLPSVNFSDYVVVAVVDTPRPTGGHSITIASIQPTSSGVTVHASAVSPGQGAIVTQAFNQPFHIVTVATFSGEATLVLSQSVDNFSP